MIYSSTPLSILNKHFQSEQFFLSALKVFKCIFLQRKCYIKFSLARRTACIQKGILATPVVKHCSTVTSVFKVKYGWRVHDTANLLKVS